MQVLDGWKEIKELVDNLEFDVTKNSVKGNAAAGVRVRKALRHLASLSRALVKLTVQLDKKNKETKPVDPTPVAE